MKKIEFGFNNSEYPNGAWEGIGINPDLLLTEAEYYGAILYCDESYIVAKVINDKYNRYPKLLNKFIVRPAIADMRADGTGTIFLDQNETEVSKYLENTFNYPSNKGKTNSINDILRNFMGVSKANRAFDFLTLEDSFIVVSINHENFEIMNNALKNCSCLFSELQKQIKTYKRTLKR